MSEAATREPHRLIAATVGVAIPRDRELYGYLSEHHSFGESEDIAGDYAEELAAEMLATTLGLEFDPDKSWDEKKEVYRLSNEIVRTPERHPDRRRRQEGPVDDGRRRRRPRRLARPRRSAQGTKARRTQDGTKVRVHAQACLSFCVLVSCVRRCVSRRPRSRAAE